MTTHPELHSLLTLLQDNMINAPHSDNFETEDKAGYGGILLITDCSYQLQTSRVYRV